MLLLFNCAMYASCFICVVVGFATSMLSLHITVGGMKHLHSVLLTLVLVKDRLHTVRDSVCA